MDDLRQFLEKQKTQLETNKEEGEQLKNAWVSALARLTDLIKSALLPLVRDQLVRIEEFQSWQDEALLGRYVVTELKLTMAGGYMVLVRPVGHNTLGIRGRVDMFLERRPDRVYIFTLASESDPSSWLIVPPRDKGTGWDHSKAKPFSNSALEEALQTLLRGVREGPFS
jgi:hypothetical protein